jgi:hypothetical protein
MDVLARQGLDCAEAGRPPCGSDRALCRAKAGHYLGEDWETCPVRATLDDRRLQLVMHLEAASQQGPISDWPDSYAAWVQPLWAKLRKAVGSRTVESKGGSGAN